MLEDSRHPSVNADNGLCAGGCPLSCSCGCGWEVWFLHVSLCQSCCRQKGRGLTQGWGLLLAILLLQQGSAPLFSVIDPCLHHWEGKSSQIQCSRSLHNHLSFTIYRKIVGKTLLDLDVCPWPLLRLHLSAVGAGITPKKPRMEEINSVQEFEVQPAISEASLVINSG